MTDHKDYLDEQYRLAAQDYRMARNEDEQWSARRRMARPKEPLLSCTGLSLQIAYMKNMSILYWTHDFFR